MGAIGECKVRRIVERGLFQTGFHALGQVIGHERGHGNIHKALGLLGRAFDVHCARGAVVDHIFHIHLKLMGGNFQHLIAHFTGAYGQSRTAHRSTAAAVCTQAKWRAPGVAVDDLHIFHGDAQLVGHNLRKCGFVALTVRVRTGHHRYFAGGMHADHAAFPQTDAGAQAHGHL